MEAEAKSHGGGFCCKCVRGYYRVEQESWEPFTRCAEIQLDKRMWPCFLSSLLLSLHPWASVCIPSPRLPVSPSISFLFCSLVTMWAQCEMCLFVSFGNLFPRPRNWRHAHTHTHTQTHWYMFPCAQTLRNTHLGTHTHMHWRECVGVKDA